MMVSVPYAMKAADADTLGGLPLSAFVTREETGSESIGGSTSSASSRLSPLATNGFAGFLSSNVAGTGGEGYVPLWLDGAGTLGNSHIFDNGKIGIGTSNPNFSLDIENSDTTAAGAQLLNVQTPSVNGARIFFNSLATNGHAYGIGSNFISGLGEFGVYDYSANAIRMVINKSGFMGIGVTDPKFSLDIANADTSAAGSSLLQLTTPSRNGAKIIFNSTAANGRSYGFGSNFITGTGEFGIYDYNASATRLVVTETGNVGIGTSAPSAILEVAGNFKVSGNGNGITFPDGSRQISAAIGGSGVTLTSPDGSIAVGGTSSAPTVAVNSVTVGRISGASCSTGQVLQWGGSSWACATVSGFGGAGGATLGSNTFTGDQSINGNITASGVVTASSFNLGSNPFASGSYANQNAFVGFAGNPTMTGTYNFGGGYLALSSNTTGQANTALGNGALQSNTTAWGNTAIGDAALFANKSAQGNTATGMMALTSNVTGEVNTADGTLTLFSNTTGHYNTASGYMSLYYNDVGSNNTASGRQALQVNTSGNENTAFGGYALYTNTTGSQNTAIGFGANVATGNLTNATAIGANANVAQSNSLALGGTGSNAVNVGIGTATPQYTLDVVGTAHTSGNLSVGGTLSKGAGSFKIDHPLDPEHKFLYHSFVESPDMMNIYNGNATLNAKGEAWVTMPDWFEALNQDFRYQLTCIGRFMPVYIAKEIKGNRFKIAGGRPNGKISWQVTGIRHDAFANEHRIPVEEVKSESEQGTYLHPSAFHQ
jgi:hypothetical protein